VSEDIVSGSGYTVSSLLSLGGDSGCNVVDEETESSWSEVLDGVGELARREESEVELVSFVERIFWVIRVCEKGRACAGNGFE
jgi:hypothetical protein